MIKFYEDELAAPESAQDSIVDTPLYVKISYVVLPIAGVTIIVYGILLYLLKDAKLLEIERAENVKAAEDRTETKGIEAELKLTKLRGTRGSDVEVLASSRDYMVSWAGLDDQLLVWKRIGPEMEFSDRTTLDILTSPPSSILQLSIDPLEKFCAAATTSGKMLIWNLETRSIVEFPSSTPDYGVATHLLPAPLPFKGSNAPPESKPAVTSSGFLSAHQNGSLVYWNCLTTTSHIVLPPTPISNPSRKSKSFFVCTQPQSNSLIFARSFSGGLVELYRSDHSEPLKNWTKFFESSLGNETNSISALAFGSFKQRDIKQEFLAVGMMDGSASVHGIKAGDSICALEKMEGPIKAMRLVDSTTSKCVECSAPILDGSMIIVSTKDLIKVSRLFTIPSPTCNCTSLPFNSKENGMESGLSKSNGISRGTPKKRRVSAFKESLLDSSLSPNRLESCTNGSILMDNIELSITNLESESIWRAEVVASIINDERGGYLVVKDSLLGIRRRTPTLLEKKVRAQGVVGRTWELWTISLVDGSRLEAVTTLESLLKNEETSTLITTSTTGDLLRRRNTTKTVTMEREVSIVENSASSRLEPVSLPFSRARPIILVSPSASAPGIGSGIGIGLGNVVVIVTPKKG